MSQNHQKDQENNWIINYVKLHQLKYPSISQNPLAVLQKFLFSNSGASEIQNGELLTHFEHGMYVPHSVYYKNMLPFATMKEKYLDYNAEYEIDKKYKSLKDTADMVQRITGEKQKEDLWKKATDDIYNQWDYIDLVENYTIEDLCNSDVYLKMIDDNCYLPYLQLHKGYFKADKFTELTDEIVLDIASAISTAYIERMSALLQSDDFSGKDSLFGGFGSDSTNDAETCKKVYPNDIMILKSLIKQIQYLKHTKYTKQENLENI